VRATHVKITDTPVAVTIQFELAIRDAIVAGAKPSSPSHALEQRGDVIALKAGSRLDRDIVVRWPVAPLAPGLSLAAARPASGNDAFALLAIEPPAKQSKPVAVPRDLIVLLDTSGSMSGGTLDEAKQVVAMPIDSLDEQDRLELIEFNSSPRRYRDEPVQATASAKSCAITRRGATSIRRRAGGHSSWRATPARRPRSTPRVYPPLRGRYCHRS
jgi:Ca-activated chloride channel family protein